MSLTLEQVEDILRTFTWDDYGFDNVTIALRENPDAQEWVGHLAAAIVGVDRELTRKAGQTS